MPRPIQSAIVERFPPTQQPAEAPARASSSAGREPRDRRRGPSGRQAGRLVLGIRPFEAGDRDAVVELWRRCGLVVPWNDPAKDIARKQNVRGDLFLVGLRDGVIIASVMAGYEGHRGWINYLAVSPDHRDKGYGRRMMEEAERRLRAEGCPKINLQVRASNRGVAAFYKAIGFVQDDVISFGKRLEHDGKASLA
jgi:ribosomal protein S18 acetylase RimI-like enzyme